MLNKKIKARDIVKLFGFKILNLKQADLEREINGPSIERLGLELAGFHVSKKFAKNIIVWGTKEYKWFKSLKKDKAQKAINQALSNKIPLVILSIGMSGQVVNWIVEECSKNNILVSKSELHFFSINSIVGWYLATHFAKKVIVHASLVIINGVGVMIIGKSGIGKSESLIELLQKGHSFISDDTIVIKRIGNQLIGSPAKITKDILEVRGIGLINIPYIYGQKSTKQSTKIELVVELVDKELLNKVDRLGDKNLKYKLMDSFIHKIQIPVYNGRSTSALIEAATNVYLARKSHIDPLDIIQKRSK